MSDPSSSLFSLLDQAGPTMFPLYICSLAALAIILRKGVEFRVARLSATDALAFPEAEADLEALAQRYEADDSPLGRVMAATARAAETRPDRAEQVAIRAATAELDRFEKWLSLLGFIAQAAPLFGLLGTVLGMVDLFSSMQAAGDEVSTTTLSAGIWKALLTTAAGLMVAIPSLGAHLWLSRRLHGLQHRFEEGIGRILDDRPAAQGE